MQRTRGKRASSKTLNAIVEAGVTCLFLAALAGSGCEHTSVPNPGSTGAASGLPRLVDLGARQCIPCQRMAPILEELREAYAGSLEVVFIDVSQDSAAAEIYHIRSIPTQVFLDASGNERFRHEGFLAKEEILAKWKELGFSLEEKRPTSTKES